MPSSAPARIASTDQRQAYPEIDPIIGGAQADRVGADAEERRLRQIDLPAQPEHDGKSEHRDRVGSGLHQDIQPIPIQRGARRDRDDDRAGDEIADMR